MKTITLTDIVNGQQVAQAKTYNTELFNSDRETLELGTDNTIVTDDYDTIFVTNTTTKESQLAETIIATKGADAYLISATSRRYNGESTVTASIQELSLGGYNYFTKDEDTVNTEYYNQYLIAQGFEVTIQDIAELGEFKADYNCTILNFTANNNKHWLTLNKLGQLSKITIKPLDNGREVQRGQNPWEEKQAIKSILG